MRHDAVALRVRELRGHKHHPTGCVFQDVECDFRVAVEAKLDKAALVNSEWPLFKLNAAHFKQQAGTAAQSSRKFANWLLTSEAGLSEASYPNLRILFQIMLTIPASSVQPVRTPPTMTFSLSNTHN